MLIKKVSDLVKEWNYFLQVNDLYKVEEQKVRVNDTLLEENLRFNWVYGYLGKEKNEFETILIVKIHKDGSVF